MGAPDPFSRPEIMSSYELGQRLVDEQSVMPVTTRVTETQRKLVVENGQPVLYEREVEIEQSVGHRAHRDEVRKSPSWIERVFRSGR